MIQKYTRQPNFSIEIRRPDYAATPYTEESIVIFDSTTNDGHSIACVGYNFSESLKTLDTPFSLQLTLESNKDGDTWYDRIHVRDLVFINEHGKTRYAGYVQNRRYQARMTDKGPARTIIINGNNIGGMLTNFKFLMDLHILNGNQTARAAADEFMQKIAGNIAIDQNLGALIQEVIKVYFKMMDTIGQSQNKGVPAVIEKYFDFQTWFKDTMIAQYPYTLSAFQVGENNLWDTISNIITPPFHEMFGLWSSVAMDTPYEIHLRPTPFEPTDWHALPITTIPSDIPALFLRDYDVGDSDQDTKTLYGCFLPGSGMSREQALTYSNFELTLAMDKDKWPYYGYRPLFVELQFFDRSKQSGPNKWTGDTAMIKKYSEQLQSWFKNNSEFLTGSVVIENVLDSKYQKYPQIGERLGFLGGEFYIEDTQNSWSYMGEMSRTLTITRGYKYGSGGDQVGHIDKVGQKVVDLEAGDA